MRIKNSGDPMMHGIHAQNENIHFERTIHEYVSSSIETWPWTHDMSLYIFSDPPWKDQMQKNILVYCQRAIVSWSSQNNMCIIFIACIPSGRN